MPSAADRAFQAKDGVFHDYPAAVDIVYKGTFVGIDSATGNARPLTAGDQFGGIATEQCDNSGGSAGDKQVIVRRRGMVRITGQTGFAASAVGELIYASDDDTLTLTSTSNTLMGRVSKFESATIIWVELSPV